MAKSAKKKATKATKSPARAAKKTKKSTAKKRSASAPAGDAEKVKAYMSGLKHPLKAEMEAVRKIIKKSHSGIAERIKWNAPSYYYKGEDMVTFNAWADKNVHLVFHHPAIVTIKSDLLEGNYDKRRMTYFNTMKEITAAKKELERIMRELISAID